MPRQKEKLREKGWSNNLLLRRSDGKTTTCVAIYVDDVPPAAGGRMLVPIYQLCQKGALGLDTDSQTVKLKASSISTVKITVELTDGHNRRCKRTVNAIYVDDVPQWIADIEELNL